MADRAPAAPRSSSDNPIRTTTASSSPLSINTDVFDDQFASDLSDSHLYPHSAQENPFRSAADSDGTPSAQHSTAPSRTPSQSSQHGRTSQSISNSTIPVEADSIRQVTETRPLGEVDLESSTRRESIAPSVAHRTISSVSSYAPPLSPASGNSGPSHPYGMYPQGLGMSRSTSVATTSTVRGPSSRQTPAHPYGLYPQNVAGDATEMSQISIPVGFPGHAMPFHRRIGPEGEEGDIYGADGHTEQLPPYTRYPEEYHTKIAGGAPLPAIGETLHGENSQTSESTPEMQERSRGQETTSTQPQTDPEQNPNSQQTENVNDSNRLSRRSWKEMSWKERRSAKLFGCLPLWMLLFVLIVAAISAIVCGIVIGAVIGTNKKAQETGLANNKDPAPFVTTTTVYLDAKTIPVPSNLPTPTQGLYEVKFNDTYEEGHTCLVHAGQRVTWTCDMYGPGNDIYLTIFPAYGKPTVNTGPLGNGTLFYGARPPQVDSQALALVIDENDPSMGPAYHFQTTYSKLVILHASEFDLAMDKSALYNLGLSGGIHRRALEPHDNPWFCWWNSTFIEGFIYMKHPVTTTSSSSSTSITSANGQTTTGVTAAPPTTTGLPRRTSTPTPLSSPPPKYPGTNAAFLLPRSFSESTHYLTSTQSAAPALTPFPYMVKMAERRLDIPDKAAACTKMNQVPDGSYEPLLSPQGVAQIIELEEQRDPPAPGAPPRDVPFSGCFCEWQYAY